MTEERAVTGVERAAQVGNEVLGRLHGERVTLPIPGELWREYEWFCPVTGEGSTYRINGPVAVHFRPHGTTHVVVDRDGVAHCVPMPGRYGCVLRWYNGPDVGDPARF